MRRPLATFLFALVLFQSLGLPLQRHWCGGAVAAVALLGQGHACCAPDAGGAARTGDHHAADLHLGCDRSASRVALAPQPAEPTPGFEARGCCFDDLVWRVDNLDAAGEPARLDIAAASSADRLPAGWSYAPDVALAQRLRPGAGLRAPPPYGSRAHTRPDQRRARLQVYLI